MSNLIYTSYKQQSYCIQNSDLNVKLGLKHIGFKFFRSRLCKMEQIRMVLALLLIGTIDIMRVHANKQDYFGKP